jgi:hypothetical protein
MNDSDFPKYGLTLEKILHRTNGDLQSLSIEELRQLEKMADDAIFNAGIALDFVQKVIAKKLANQGASNDDRA